MNKKLAPILLFIVLMNNTRCSVLDLSLTAAGVFFLRKIVYTQYDINRYQRTSSPDWQKYEEIKKETEEQKKLKALEDFLNSWDQHYLKHYKIKRTVEDLDKLQFLLQQYNKRYRNNSNDYNHWPFQYQDLYLIERDIKREIQRSRNMQCLFLVWAMSFLIGPGTKAWKNLKTYFNQ